MLAEGHALRHVGRRRPQSASGIFALSPLDA